MSDEMPGTNLNVLVDRLKIKLKDYAQRLKAKEDELKIAEAARDEATGKIEAVKSKYDDSKLKAEVDRLKGEIRESKHFTKLSELAKAKGVRPDAVEDLRRLTEYKAEGDEPDEVKINALIDEQKSKRPFLFGEPAPEGGGTSPGPGRGQGGSAGGGNGKFRVTRAQLADPHWCRENHDRRKEAMKAGTMEIVD
jgi:hypothetical protein